jgi:hypothetical protein
VHHSYPALPDAHFGTYGEHSTTQLVYVAIPLFLPEHILTILVTAVLFPTSLENYH